MPPSLKSSAKKSIYSGPTLPGIGPDRPPAPPSARVHAGPLGEKLATIEEMEFVTEIIF
jgi:hypothetical protein